jgi:hypothetical protein
MLRSLLVVALVQGLGPCTRSCADLDGREDDPRAITGATCDMNKGCPGAFTCVYLDPGCARSPICASSGPPPAGSDTLREVCGCDGTTFEVRWLSHRPYAHEGPCKR